MDYFNENSKSIKVSDLISRDHYMIMVLERFGINLGMQEKTIGELCTEKGIDIDLFLTIAQLHIDSTDSFSYDFKIDDLKTIVSYLIKSHEYYSKEILPSISESLNHLGTVGNDITYTLLLNFFSVYKEEVDKHLKYEEMYVYPYALDILKDPNYKIKEYKNHHPDIESKLIDLKNLLIKYLPKDEHQILKRNILIQLLRFEKDLNIHTIIEEAILIPLIEKKEKQ